MTGVTTAIVVADDRRNDTNDNIVYQKNLNNSLSKKLNHFLTFYNKFHNSHPKINFSTHTSPGYPDPFTMNVNARAVMSLAMLL